MKNENTQTFKTKATDLGKKAWGRLTYRPFGVSMATCFSVCLFPQFSSI
jgi:hypothetical protein